MAALHGRTPILFCQGEDDVAFIRWIVEKQGIPGFQLSSLEGEDRLVPKIKVRLRELPGGVLAPAVGVVLDADSEPDARRDAARDARVAAVPSARHAVYLLPDDGGEGMLEDLLLDSCRLPDRVSCAKAFVECAEAAFPHPINASKARYDAYCGVVRPTQHGVRKGINDDELDIAHPSLSGFVAFLRKLSS